MKKGIYGFSLWYYVAMALLCTFMGQLLLVGAILGFVLVYEKDEWLTKQMLQVFTLSVSFTFIMAIIHEVGKLVKVIPFLGNGVMGLVDSVAYIILLVIVLSAYGTIKSGNNLSLPLAQALVNKAYEFVSRKSDNSYNTPPANDTRESSQEWVCSHCGTRNVGKFCKECGTGQRN